MTLLWLLLLVYGLASCITTLDTRIIQANKAGDNIPMLPLWTGLFFWVQWGSIIAVLIIDWRLGVKAMIVQFILRVLPVLEIIGNILMRPFRKKTQKNNHQH